MGVGADKFAPEERPGENEDEPRVLSGRKLRQDDDSHFPLVLGDAASVLEKVGIPYALIGGLASRGFGRPRSTHDIDIMVKPEDALRTLDALALHGFRTEKTDVRWLFKAFKHDVMVDIIFMSTGGIHFDAEMLAHAVYGDYQGHRVRYVAPEDLLIMKAVVSDEEGPRHWHDALGLLSGRDLDWDYLLRRARRAPRRVLSLLIYAHSLDMFVPTRVIRELYQKLYDN